MRYCSRENRGRKAEGSGGVAPPSVQNNSTGVLRGIGIGSTLICCHGRVSSHLPCPRYHLFLALTLAGLLPCCQRQQKLIAHREHQQQWQHPPRFYTLLDSASVAFSFHSELSLLCAKTFTQRASESPVPKLLQ